MQHIATELPDCKIGTIANLNINPDAKVAALFAILETKPSQVILGQAQQQVVFCRLSGWGK